MGELRPSPGERPVVLIIGGPIAREHIPGMCRRVDFLLEVGPSDPVVCDVGALDEPDAVTVDALARLQLTARRKGSRVWFLDARPQLDELLDLMGLRDVIPPAEDLLGETGGQAEEGEEPRGVQEERDAADPIP